MTDFVRFGSIKAGRDFITIRDERGASHERVTGTRGVTSRGVRTIVTAVGREVTRHVDESAEVVRGRA